MPAASSDSRSNLVELPRPERKTPTAPEVPLLLRVDEAARLLSLGRSTVYQMVAAKELPAVHIGRTTRIPRQALDEWLAHQLAKAWQTQ